MPTAVLLALHLLVLDGTPAVAGQPPPHAAAEEPDPTPASVAEARDSYLTEQSRDMFLLMGWGQASAIVAGLGFLVFRSPFAHALQLQGAVWGIVDAGLAINALLALKSGQGRALSAEAWAAERARSRRVFWWNALADLGYLLIGGSLWLLGRRPFPRGSGAGIVLQSSFLFVFHSLAGWAIG